MNASEDYDDEVTEEDIKFLEEHVRKHFGELPDDVNVGEKAW